MLQLYNTLTNQKEKFEPLNPGKVTMYVCGPTVYNYIHIGNARSAVAFDTIRRYLEYRGFEVNYVSNFTDVDDKIIKASQEMNLSVKEITEKFINAFYEDTSALNVKKATLNPRVMDNMDDIIKFIEVLVQKGYAYESAGDVYYKTRKFKDYGKLSGQLIDDLEQGASSRVDDIDQDKKQDPLDFALWKKVKQGEISWNSPWGQGRPGWHIECSVMSTKYLGDTIDIHAGGQDLFFPHHENEASQTRCLREKELAKYWMHNGFVTINGEKMSKSLGNSFFVKDALKVYHGEILRNYLLSTHYRSPLHFNEEDLLQSKKRLDKIYRLKKRLDFQPSTNIRSQYHDSSKHDEYMQSLLGQVNDDFKKALFESLYDDLNISLALSVIEECIKQTNDYLDSNPKDKAYKTVAKANLELVDSILGLGALSYIEYFQLGVDSSHKERIESLIAARLEAKKNKDFAKADKIRNDLEKEGIVLMDKANNVTEWEKV